MFILPIYEESLDKIPFDLFEDRSFWVLNYHSFMDDILDQVAPVGIHVEDVGGFKKFVL